MRLYEIIIQDVVIDPGLELIHEDPRAASFALEFMRQTFGPTAVSVVRDGEPITAVQLAGDIETYEIRQVIEQDTQLPSTYRHGRGGDSDLAFGTDGYAHAVDKPPTPEDNCN